MKDPLQATLADAVGFLERHGVRYALVGGLAASLRGQPRVTADVDMVIEVDIDGAMALLAEFDGSKFAPLFDDVTDVVQSAFILPARHRTTGVKLDMAIGLSGFERQTIQRAETLDFGNCHVAVATSEDLLVMKVLAGRPQDEQDVRGIIVAQSEHIDWDYCLDLANQLGQAVGQDLVRRLVVLRSETTL